MFLFFVINKFQTSINNFDDNTLTPRMMICKNLSVQALIDLETFSYSRLIDLKKKTESRTMNTKFRYFLNIGRVTHNV